MSEMSADMQRQMAQSTRLIQELLPVIEGYEARIVGAAFATVLAMHIRETAADHAEKVESVEMVTKALTAAVFGRAHTS